MKITLAEFFKPVELGISPTKSDYEKAALLIQAVKAFSRTTNQSVYVIDYYKRTFLYVSENPLFLCGETAKSVTNLGYMFYMKHVPEKDLQMLLEINQAGFEFFKNIPHSDRLKYTISYDFHLIQSNNHPVLVNHKLTPMLLDSQYNIWLALCVVSHSSSNQSGNVIISETDGSKVFEYNLLSKKWAEQNKLKLTKQEKEILNLSVRGFTMDEIAGSLGITVSTVKFHKKNIFQKLKVKNISEAISYASNHNIF